MPIYIVRTSYAEEKQLWRVAVKSWIAVEKKSTLELLMKVEAVKICSLTLGVIS